MDGVRGDIPDLRGDRLIDECRWQPLADGVVCVVCGALRRRPAHRVCPRAVPRANLLLISMRRCIRCEAFPCLGKDDCKHEKAMRRGVECPRGVWLWV